VGTKTVPTLRDSKSSAPPYRHSGEGQNPVRFTAVRSAAYLRFALVTTRILAFARMTDVVLNRELHTAVT
jgi:hypothetical protein